MKFGSSTKKTDLTLSLSNGSKTISIPEQWVLFLRIISAVWRRKYNMEHYWLNACIRAKKICHGRTKTSLIHCQHQWVKAHRDMNVHTAISYLEVIHMHPVFLIVLHNQAENNCDILMVWLRYLCLMGSGGSYLGLRKNQVKHIHCPFIGRHGGFKLQLWHCGVQSQSFHWKRYIKCTDDRNWCKAFYLTHTVSITVWRQSLLRFWPVFIKRRKTCGWRTFARSGITLLKRSLM